MYDYLKGMVDYIGPEYIVVENGGIGYQVVTPNPFVFSSQLRKEIQIYTYHYVSEDIITLYGFQNRQEKALFTKLIGVTGIGPKGALQFLLLGKWIKLCKLLSRKMNPSLLKFPGVGKKTARQMILDLKGKLEHIIPDAFPDLFNPESLCRLTIHQLQN